MGSDDEQQPEQQPERSARSRGQRDRMGTVTDARRNERSAEEHRLLKANRALVEERNACTQVISDLQTALRECTSIVAVLVARSGGSVFITKRDAFSHTGTLSYRDTQAGTSISYLSPARRKKGSE